MSDGLSLCVACSVGRCRHIVKLFTNYQRISEVLKDKPSSTGGGGGAGGGNKKRGRRPAKDAPVSSGRELTAAGSKSPGGMFTIHFLSAALTALFRQD